MERNLKKTRTDKVISNRMGRTIAIVIGDRVKHPLYDKIVKRTIKLRVHDGNSDCVIGGTIEVIETRPLSENKRWRLAEIIERAK